MSSTLLVSYKTASSSAECSRDKPPTCDWRRVSLYNRFCTERSPKMGFWGDFGGSCEDIQIFGGKVCYIRPQNCAFSDIFGPDLTPRVVALCMCIAICHRRKFWQVLGFPVPLPEVAWNLRYREEPLWTIDYQMEQELSYRQQIARQLRTQYAGGIYRLKYYTVAFKFKLRVTQGHWKRNRWIDHTRLSSSRVIWRWILL